MNFHRLFVCCRVLAGFCFLVPFGVLSARADTALRTINIDFGAPASPVFSGVGADAGDGGIVWNGVTTGSANSVLVPSNLLDSSGNVTPTGISIAGVTAVSTTTGTNPTSNALLQDYLVGQGHSLIITITNLIPFESYKVYMYGAGSSSGQGSVFQIGGISAATNGAVRGSAFVQGQNYVVLPTNVDDRGTMTITVTGGSSSGSPVINGLQIQQNAVPPTISPSFTDAFDVSQGTVIIGGSPTEVGGLEPAIGGRSPTSPEPENVLFAFNKPAGTVHYFEFQMSSVKKIQSINIFANYDDYNTDGTPGNIDIAGASRMTLWAFNSVTQAYDIKAFEIFPANPYTLTLAPPGAAVQNDGAPSLLIVTANIVPVTTDRFRMELVQAGSFGVRIAELDGFAAPNPGLAASSPIVTTASSTNGQVGTPLSYQLAGSNNPTSYSARNLPDGLSLNPATGLISGIPTAAGDFDAAVASANQTGQGPITTLRFEISPAGDNIQGISILSPPTGIKVIQNQPVVLYASVKATASTLASVQFSAIDSNNVEIPLFSGNVARPSSTWQPTAVGDYSLKVLATDTQGHSKFLAETIHVLPSAGLAAPQISLLNGNFLNAAGGQSFVLGSSIQIVASATGVNGSAPAAVQFFLDDQPIPTAAAVSSLSVDRGIGRPARWSARAADTSSAATSLLTANIPLTKLEQLITAVVTDSNGVSTVSEGVKIIAESDPANVATVVIDNADGTPLNSGSAAPAMVSVAATNPARRIASVSMFADTQPVGAPLTAAPYNFSLAGLAPGQHVLTALAIDDANVSVPSVPVIVEGSSQGSNLPVVSVQASVPQADAGTGQTGVFTVSRAGGDPTKKLKVFYTVAGSAVNGVEYTVLSGVAKIKPGATSAQIVVNPIRVAGDTGTRKVKLKLAASAQYTLGSASGGKVKILFGE